MGSGEVAGYVSYAHIEVGSRVTQGLRYAGLDLSFVHAEEEVGGWVMECVR